MEKAVQVKNLTKNFKIRTNKNIVTGIFKPNYKHVEAVKNISFEVEEGESLAFLGPNGAGKTTTTKMLTGLIYPSEGEAKVLGYTPFKRNREFLRQIGLVMGNKSGLSWDLTGQQNFDFIKSIYQLEDSEYKKNLNQLAELLDIKKLLNKRVRKLSLGERMKMELIGAILHRPKVLFLDEPTIGLDITSKKNIRTFLRDIQHNSNITLILTSHDMDDVEKVCDRVIVINEGRKVYDDYLEKLMAEYNQRKFIKFYFEKAPEKVEVCYAEIVEEIPEEDALVYEVKKEEASQLITTVIEHTSVLDIDIVSIPLEEMIEDIFKKSSEVSTIA
ncbi:ATP-binding cassette domain-containing protein [candidate division WWE3 bacterium]|nr:ATP-binding cassette domain-containing protein [candidate division WWE3 bacterium]